MGSYEFIGLLKGERLVGLTKMVQPSPALNEPFREAVGQADAKWPEVLLTTSSVQDGTSFARALKDLRIGLMGVAYSGERLSERPSLLVKTILELAARTDGGPQR